MCCDSIDGQNRISETVPVPERMAEMEYAARPITGKTVSAPSIGWSGGCEKRGIQKIQAGGLFLVAGKRFNERSN
jgi:hypothetical protein